jgi:ankyrin repeat protein
LDKSPASAQKLCDAAKNGDVEGVKKLLEAGVDPDGVARDGKTPLMAAAGGGHLRVVEALLEGFADPNFGKGSDTPMTIAFQKGNQDVLKALFAASFNTLDSMVNSRTALGGSGPLGDDGRPRTPFEEWSESAQNGLRGQAKKLASLAPGRRDGFDSPGASRRLGGYAEQKKINLSDDHDSDMLREQSVRMTMKRVATDGNPRSQKKELF